MEQPADENRQDPSRRPLLYLAPVVPEDGPIAPETDRVLADIARTAGHGDRIARDSLYWAVAGRLEPSVWRLYRLHAVTQRRCVLELEDVRQAGYLAFVDMVNAWKRDDSFATYLFGMFGWRLRHELRQYSTRREIALPARAIAHEREQTSGAEALDRLLDQLPERQRLIIELRVNRNLPFDEIRAILGVSSRTIQRDLQAIAQAITSAAEK